MTSPRPKPDVALIGLAAMGQNLALNIARKGFPLVVHNRTAERTRAFLEQRVHGEPIFGADSLAGLVEQTAAPRTVLLMVKAGAPVDETLAALLPLLSADDIVIDAGNSHPDATERRFAEVEQRGVHYVGLGVSGGEQGALEGASLMPGCDQETYARLAPMLEAIAAQASGEPCVAHLGPGATGHFVKMVHNGIEYADMQLIAETHDLMRHALRLQPAEQAAVFARWNDGDLAGYLIEITAHILEQHDAETGTPMVDVILDRAGQKGTGRWTAELALRLGVPVPTIHAAVSARGLSARLAERRRAAAVLTGPDSDPVTDRRLVDDLEHALYAAKVCSYAQGFDLLRHASAHHGWQLDLGAVARIWRNGCIIRAALLERITEAYAAGADLPHLLLDPGLGARLGEHQRSWREVVGLAATSGVPALAFGASLSYFDSYRRDRLPQALTQAQRDLFGAHTFERVDRPEGERFHHEWGFD